MARIACIAVPDLPLQALLRAEPELAGLPLAVTPALARAAKARGPARTSLAVPATQTREGSGGQAGAAPLASRILAVTDEAMRLGVRPGQTVAQARAIAPTLLVRAAHPGQIQAARAALFDAALGFAPRVEASGDVAWLEVGDLGRLFPTEREVALALRARARAVGLVAGVGVASSKSVARLAAHAAITDAGDTGDTTDASIKGGRPIHDMGEVRVLRPVEEAGFVAALPVTSLLCFAEDSRSAHSGSRAGERGSMDKEFVEAVASLSRWGVESCGRLAALPAREVALRLGAAGARLHLLATGRHDEPLAARAPSDEFEEGLELDFSLEDLEALGFVLRGIVERLLARLAARHLACASLGLRLQLEYGGHDVRQVPLAAPTRDAASLLTLIRLSVERRPPPAGIVSIALFARAACAPESQLDLFRPSGPSPEKLATTVAKLQALVEEGEAEAAERAGSRASVGLGARATEAAMNVVGSPRPVDNHREEAIAVVPFAPPPASVEPCVEVAAGQGRLGFRRFRPERAVEVLLDGGSVPRALSGDGISCHVVIAAGPFRVCGEWWAEAGWARDYWDVHATDGALYRLYRDRRGQWFVGGYYD